MIHAEFDAAGLPLGFFDDRISDPATIPEAAVEITDAQYQEFLNNQGLRRWDGASVVSYEPPPAPPTLPPDISDRQFARGLWGDGIITYTDFLGFIGPGTIPAPIEAIVSQLPDDDTGAPTARKDAVGFLTGSKLYQFGHPLV